MVSVLSVQEVIVMGLSILLLKWVCNIVVIVIRPEINDDIPHCLIESIEDVIMHLAGMHVIDINDIVKIL